MDYGKLAYMKVEDLEARIGSERKSDYKSAAVSASPNVELNNGKFDIAEFKSDGSATVICKILVDVETLGACGVKLITADGLVVASKIFRGGRQEELFLGNVLAKSGKLIISVSGKCKIVSFELVFIGAGASLSRSGGDFRAVGCSVGANILYSKDSRVLLMIPSTSIHNEFTLYEEIGIGQMVDGCQVGDGFCIIYCDFFGNVWGVNGIDRKNEKRFLVGNYVVKSISIARRGAELIIGIVGNDNKLNIIECDYTFGSKREMLTDIVADRVNLLSTENDPIIIVEKGGNIELRFVEREVKANAIAQITADFSYTIIQ